MVRMDPLTDREALYRGLRMTADEYLDLPDDGFRYELINGVVCVMPSPTLKHQEIAAEVVGQLRHYLVSDRIGRLAAGVDVQLGDDLVYRPDVMYIGAEKGALCDKDVTEAPDLVVEIISPDSRNYDSQTKRADYEAAGVGEYWLIDAQRRSFCFLVLRNGRYEEVAPVEDRYASHVLPGFELDLDAIRKLF